MLPRCCYGFGQAREAAEQARTAALTMSSGSSEQSVALTNQLQQVQQQVTELTEEAATKQIEWAAREEDLRTATDAATAELVTAKQAAEALQEQLNVVTQDLDAAKTELASTEVSLFPHNVFFFFFFWRFVYVFQCMHACVCKIAASLR